MNAANEKLRRELLAMRAEDVRVREELARTGELFDGYHPQMEVVHLKNAARLEELMPENCWFSAIEIGEDGLEAAWLIVQHAISRPDLQRKLLPILRRAAEKGEIPARHFAYLQDRILFFEGKPQIYGTQFDWNERGEMAPLPISEPEKIDERRAAVGLETPFAVFAAVQTETFRRSNEKPPADFRERQRKFKEWAHKVGWR